jgi:segregation and condensation protein B
MTDPTDDAITDVTEDVTVDVTDDVTVVQTEGETEPEGESVPGLAESAPTVEDLAGAIEAVLLVVDEPVSEVTLAQVLEHPVDDVVAQLRALAEQYTEDGRGFELREVAGGWRYYSRAEFSPWVEKFVLDGQQAKLTQAGLETLAVVAYRQPVSRGRISAVRGVNVDGVMRTLLARGLVEEVGAENETGAILYGTSAYFLERLGLRSLDELPELAPYLPELDTLDLEPENGDPIGSHA